MKILLATFECVPFIKVGGLADVTGTLPKYIKAKEHDIRIVMPLHRKIDRKKYSLTDTKEKVLVPVGGEIAEGSIWKGRLGIDVPVYFIENEKYFNREEVYRTSEGDYNDNDERFIFFCRSALEMCKSIDFKPDIIHCNDMQTGLLPAYMNTLYRIDAFFSHTSTVYTIHNIAYQGIYSQKTLFAAGFSWGDFTPEKLEYYGQVNFMKAGIVYSDIVSTVSPTYAKEIQATKEHGRGLEGILSSRSKDIYGIINGIDYVEWDPEKDKLIKKNYALKIPEGKKECKKDLQNICGLPRQDVPLFGMVSRLDSLKGFDILNEIIMDLAGMPLQIIIQGVGDKIYQDTLTALAKKYRNKISVNIKFDNDLAHKIYAGSDIFLMPSKSEPCGLGQMIALRYGAIPVAHKTGGLADSIAQYDSKSGEGYGFLFSGYNSAEMLASIKQALGTYKSVKAWNTVVANAMKQDFSWNKSVKEYLKIYELAIKNKAALQL